MSGDREQLIREYEVWEDTARAVRRDIEQIKEGRTAGYSVDFSVLFPYLWRSGRVGEGAPRQSRWDLTCRSVCLELLRYQLPARARFVLTSVSFIEAVEYAHRHVQQQISLRDDVGSGYAQLREEVDGVEKWLATAISDDLSTRRQLEEKLDSISLRFGIGAAHSLSRLRTFIVPGGPLVGIRDIVSSDLGIKKLVDRFNHLYNEMERTRGSMPSETRSSADRSFHYKIDCANIVLCEAVADTNSNTNLGFVTRASNKRHLLREHGRTSLMVLLLLRLNRLTEYPDFASRYEFLGYMATDAIRIIQDLKRRSSIDLNREQYLAGHIAKFERDYVKLVFGGVQESPPAGPQVADFREVSSSEDRYRERLAASIEDTSKDLRKIVEDHSALLDDELLTTFKIDSDPRARAILFK